ncbi:GFA family protein [Pseudomonas alliivorans]|nr:GFA family protein [Pseudomonas alliivorans]MEE4650402.1 GFA family protein [Pseudomonas alliivorans]MEE4664713.1 GFA family protein [Pseudomonas alliivorans]MEE4681598.1 GFA family protein [Pseudomonas alliivorans]MEE4896755.1 GFA family protein [Pseudomonas alliivorans]
MSQIHIGGCHCGNLRYQFDAPLKDIAHCHCSICRRTSGGTVMTWITVPLTSFQWLAGSPATYDSGPTCIRYFCGNCGAHAALFTRNSPQEIDVVIATLDHPELAAPARHIFIENRLPWLHLDEHLPGREGESD